MIAVIAAIKRYWIVGTILAAFIAGWWLHGLVCEAKEAVTLRDTLAANHAEAIRSNETATGLETELAALRKHQIENTEEPHETPAANCPLSPERVSRLSAAIAA